MARGNMGSDGEPCRYLPEDKEQRGDQDPLRGPDPSQKPLSLRRLLDLCMGRLSAARLLGREDPWNSAGFQALMPPDQIGD